NVTQQSRLYADRRLHVGAGDWRKQRDFQLLQWGVAAPTSLSTTGTTRAARRDCDKPRRRVARCFLAELSGLARAESCLFGPGRLSGHHVHADGGWRRGRIVWSVYLGQVVRVAWRCAAIGTRVYAGREPAGTKPRGDPELRPVATTLRRRSKNPWQNDHAGQSRLGSRWRSAARLQVSRSG